METSEVLSKVKMQFKQDQKALDQSSFGDYIGSGVGTAEGKLSGEVVWDLFETKSGNVCETKFKGVIDTKSGEIKFTVFGLYLLPDIGTIWKFTGAVRFETDIEDYKWLTKIAASWNGTFDQQSGFEGPQQTVVTSNG